MPDASAESLWFLNTLVSIRVSAQKGSDSLSVLEHRAPFGDSPPLHLHQTEDEVFYVLEGEFRSEIAAGFCSDAPNARACSRKRISRLRTRDCRGALRSCGSSDLPCWKRVGRRRLHVLSYTMPVTTPCPGLNLLLWVPQQRVTAQLPPRHNGARL